MEDSGLEDGLLRMKHRLRLTCREYHDVVDARQRRAGRATNRELHLKGVAVGLATAIALIENPTGGYGRTLDRYMEAARVTGAEARA